MLSGCKFHLVDGFHETDFVRTSKGGMRGFRSFELNDELDVSELPRTEEISGFTLNRPLGCSYPHTANSDASQEMRNVGVEIRQI